MKYRAGSFWASCATLLLATNAAWACDKIAHVPDTLAAKRSAEFLERVTRALHAQFADCAAEGAEDVRTLWIFPTADSNTVFVHYGTSAAAAGSDTGVRSRLLLLEMRGAEIAKLLDLASAATDADAPAVVASGPR